MPLRDVDAFIADTLRRTAGLPLPRSDERPAATVQIAAHRRHA
jgi:hypothetical protein